MKADDVKRLKELEVENAWLKRSWPTGGDLTAASADTPLIAHRRTRGPAQHRAARPHETSQHRNPV